MLAAGSAVAVERGGMATSTTGAMATGAVAGVAAPAPAPAPAPAEIEFVEGAVKMTTEH
jgi:hypothetical protein